MENKIKLVEIVEGITRLIRECETMDTTGLNHWFGDQIIAIHRALKGLRFDVNTEIINLNNSEKE